MSSARNSEITVRRRIDESVFLLGRDQHGVVERQQLLRIGLSPTMVRRRVESMRLVPVHRGVFGLGRGVSDDLGRWMVAVLFAGGSAALCRQSAACLWGFADLPGPVRVVRAFNQDRVRVGRGTISSDKSHRVVIHRTRSLPDSDLRIRSGIPVTSVARTLLDLSSILTARRLSGAFSEAGRAGLLDLKELQELVQVRSRQRGATILRELIQRWSPDHRATRSELEVAFLELCRNHGIQAPLVNQRVAGLEVDCLWPHRRLVVELNGFAFHNDPLAFERDHEREAILVGAGYQVLAFTYRMVTKTPEKVASVLRSTLEG